MSRENVDVVRRGFELMRSRDLDALLAFVDEVTDPNFELRGTGELPDVDAVRGPDAAKTWFKKLLSDDTFTFDAEPEEFIDAGEAVVVPTVHTALGTASGAEVMTRLVNVFGFHQGRAVYFDVFRTKERALEAVGLRE